MHNLEIPLRQHIGLLKPSPTLRINERSKALQVTGKRIYKLGFGQSPFPVPAEVIAALQAHAPEKDYLPVQGLEALREAVAEFNRRKIGLKCTAEDVLIGPGSKELLLGLQIVSDAELLLPSPSWVSYEPQAHIAGTPVKWIETLEEKRWMLTAEQLEAACGSVGSRPKILLLNYPNNPVGTTYEQEELEALAGVARKFGVLVLADEIYGELHFAGQHLSMAQFYPEGTIVSGGLSKWCGAGGWRLGTFTFPRSVRHLLEAMTTLASESFSAVSAPVQYAAIRAFTGSPAIEEYLAQARFVLREVGGFVHRELKAAGLSMPLPQGGFYLFPNFSQYRQALSDRGIHTSMQLCRQLLEDTGVALLPGTAFGRPEQELTCRLSFVDFDGARLLGLARRKERDTWGRKLMATYCPANI